jgi:hypothetical protein
MQDRARRHGGFTPPSPHLIALRRPPRVVTPGGPAGLPAEPPERTPGIRLREIHASSALDPLCSACTEDDSIVGLGYRVVLRCSTAGPGH